LTLGNPKEYKCPQIREGCAVPGGVVIVALTLFMARGKDLALAAIYRLEDGSGIIVRLHVQPQASKTELTGLYGDRLKIRVQAKPVEGAANAAVCEFLARTAGVAPSQVELIRGATGRDKDVRIICSSPSEAARNVLNRAGLEVDAAGWTGT
jgi:uncharacterized protein (TIGR00251 family)